jgi:hypothetical protein
MAIFGKKPEPPPPAIQPPLPPVQQPARAAEEPIARRPYGVAELITLMKTIPIDHQPDLVLQVIRTTLESVGVRISDIMDDASRHETNVKDRISSLEGEIDGLVQQIDRRRDLITQLQGDVTELTYAKDRWQSAQSGGIAAAPPSEPREAREPHAGPKPPTLPPPLPPPFPKSAQGKPPELV